MIDKDLLEMLACPKCKGHVEFKNNGLICGRCRLFYEIRNDIPVMLVDSARKID